MHWRKRNGNKYLTQIKTKKYFTKYTELWDKIKNLTGCSSNEKISNKSGEHEKDLMTIKCNSDDNLLLNKILKIHNMAIVIRSVFKEDGKYYPQALLDECLYEV